MIEEILQRIHPLPATEMNTLLLHLEKAAVPARTQLGADMDKEMWCCFIEKGLVAKHFKTGSYNRIVRIAIEGEVLFPALMEPPAEATRSYSITALEETIFYRLKMEELQLLSEQYDPIRKFRRQLLVNELLSLSDREMDWVLLQQGKGRTFLNQMNAALVRRLTQSQLADYVWVSTKTLRRRLAGGDELTDVE